MDLGEQGAVLGNEGTGEQGLGLETTKSDTARTFTLSKMGSL